MKWEYKILYYQNGRDPKYQGWNVNGQIIGELNHLTMSQLLNTFGTEGWELITVVQMEGDNDCHFYFKRPT